jgi:DNA-binding CsgD family transcriptional regulator
MDAPAFSPRERNDLASVMKYVAHGIATGNAPPPDAASAYSFQDSDDEAMLVTDRAGNVRHGSEKARRLLLLATTSEINPASLKAAVNDRPMQVLKTICARLEAIARGEDSAPPVITLDTKWGRHILRFVEAMGRLPLSPQQREIALKIALGKSNQEIAEGLGVSGNTVAYHIKQLFLKLNVHDRAGAVERITSGESGLRG